MPAATPPMIAGFHFTLVFGTSMNTAVKMVATMRYGETFSPIATSRSKKGM